jgi:hypothetical protein
MPCTLCGWISILVYIHIYRTFFTNLLELTNKAEQGLLDSSFLLGPAQPQAVQELELTKANLLFITGSDATT